MITNAQIGGYIKEEGIENVLTNGASKTVGGVPEPTSWAMLLPGSGLVGFAACRRRAVVAVSVLRTSAAEGPGATGTRGLFAVRGSAKFG